MVLYIMTTCSLVGGSPSCHHNDTYNPSQERGSQSGRGNEAKHPIQFTPALRFWVFILVETIKAYISKRLESEL